MINKISFDVPCIKWRNLEGVTIKTKEELAIKLNLKANQFYAICGKDNELDEIRICYDIYSEPGL